ncbi:unnamed protein product, partial [Pocillopora meandrina]
QHHEEAASGRVLSARYDHWPNLCIQEEIDAVILMKSFDPSFVIRNNVLLKEDQALLLLSVAMGLHGVVILKLALDHVPPTLSKTMRRSSRNHCWVSFSGFLEAYKEAFSAEVQKFTDCLSGGKWSLLFCTGYCMQQHAIYAKVGKAGVSNNTLC